MPYSSVLLSKIIKDFDIEVVYDPGDIESRRICVADCTRPGLQLAGYYDHFGPDRIQVIGNMEHAYLDNLDSGARHRSFDELFSKEIPAILITRNHEIHDELLDSAKVYSTPVLRTSAATSDIITEIVAYLRTELAPRMQRKI